MSECLLRTPLHMASIAPYLPASLGFRVNVPDAPAIKNPERRRAGRFDLKFFKRSYCPDLADTGDFHGPFLSILERLILSAGIVRRAVAAPRGIAKTYNTVIAAVWAMAYGHRKYIPWICRRDDYAIKRIALLTHIIQNNQILREDFPELILPFVGTTAQQIKRPLAMTGSELVLPNGAASLGFSIESALRGLIQPDGTRPDWIVLDDVIETAAGSEAETENLRQVIEENLGGLAELGGDMASLMLVTVPVRGGIADTYTTPAKKPAWNGVRFRAMKQAPARMDLWERFKELVAGTQEA